MLSIIIPTFNERQNILPLLQRLEAALGRDHEIIFVDDNSPDGTAGEIEAASKKDGRVRLVRRSGKLGLTSAVEAGAAAARGDVLLVMDADLSHPPEAVPKLAASLSGCDLAIGSRLIGGGGVEKWPLHRKLISKGADALARLVVGVRCSDPLSGFFAVKKEVFMRTRFRTRGYKLLLNLLADNPSIKVSEVPYTFRDRHAGKTKLGAWEVVNYLFDLLRIRFP